MSTSIKLIDKEFLKHSKVTQLLKLDPGSGQRLLNEIKTMEGLLDNPKKGIFAQQRLTRIVYEYMNRFFENCRQDPEAFVDFMLSIELEQSE
ncbi:hypothetical protein F4X88_06060 [Candidatus Poribacteria bacterium]|nr:hypothetical protein [Candidatus Poribacteria bacterium]MXV84005.1 hypothetical protein [Candidatus Poribacteria bacterium]MYA55838.1 hypothetical protein [Candidatus Poribacteria bacterium]